MIPPPGDNPTRGDLAREFLAGFIAAGGPFVLLAAAALAAALWLPGVLR